MNIFNEDPQCSQSPSHFVELNRPVLKNVGSESTRASKPNKLKIPLKQQASERSCEVSLHSSKIPSQGYMRRKEQNRRSAVKCRLKKKQHLDFLQNRIANLQKQRAQAKLQLATAKQSLDKYINAHFINSSFSNGRKPTYERLAQLASEESPDQDQINLLVDSLKYKVGAYGIERQGSIDYSFKQLLNYYFPPFSRYLMWITENNIEIFGQTSTEISWWNGMHSEDLQLTQRQKEELRELQAQFDTHKNQIYRDIDQLHICKSHFDEQCTRIERILEEFRKKLSPVQAAHLVVFLDRIKFMKEVHFWIDNQLNKHHEANQSTDISQEPSPTKRMKPN